MSEIKPIEFEEQSGEIKDRVQGYWTKRADSFFTLRQEEIESYKSKVWLEEIEKHISKNRDTKILDIGCGTGFFEIILGREGYRITGVDLTAEMILRSNELIKAYDLKDDRVVALVMDAENLNFEDESFDVILSRNLTWTLPHPIEAYREWFRVLRPGGLLLNFDAEYAKNAHVNLYSHENLAHKGVPEELKDECHDIYHMLTISTLERPAWDLEVLGQLGFKDVNADTGFGDRIYMEKDRFYMPDRMFSIVAVKGE